MPYNNNWKGDVIERVKVEVGIMFNGCYDVIGIVVEMQEGCSEGDTRRKTTGGAEISRTKRRGNKDERESEFKGRKEITFEVLF